MKKRGGKTRNLRQFNANGKLIVNYNGIDDLVNQIRFN